MSCHLTSSHVCVMSCHVLSCHAMPCHMTSCHVMSCHVTSCHLTSSHAYVMSCHVTSCHVTSCHVMPCHVISRLLTSCHIMSCQVTSCHVTSRHLSCEPSKFFYYGGGVAPTRFSKPWPCAGIRLGATLSLWRRVHCERLRVAPCTFLRIGDAFAWQAARIGRVGGVPRACRGCVAALCRGDWVLGAFCRRMANVRFAWQAAGTVHAGRCVAGVSRRCAVGIGFPACFLRAWPTCVSRGRLQGVRAGRCAAGVPRVCRGRAGGAVPWGLGSGRVAHAHDFMRCDLRFAWQVWDFGCIDALGKALDGGSAWQAQ